jgi:hypothetical protein
MAKVTKEERIRRPLKFLTASAEPAIAKVLMLRGFDNAEREEGWALLDRATGRHMSLSPGQGNILTQYNVNIGKLDDWENNWFDVADAALKRKAPAVREKLFKNLSKGNGIEVLLTTRTFTSRIAEMKKDQNPDVQAAMALLVKRGLTDEVIAEATGLIKQLETAETIVEPEENSTAKAEREKAMQDLWAWFLDWSQTARTVIKNGNHQIMLGLTTPSRSSSSDDETVDPLEDDGTADDEQTEATAKAM